MYIILSVSSVIATGTCQAERRELRPLPSSAVGPVHFFLWSTRGVTARNHSGWPGWLRVSPGKPQFSGNVTGVTAFFPKLSTSRKVRSKSWLRRLLRGKTPLYQGVCCNHCPVTWPTFRGYAVTPVVLYVEGFVLATRSDSAREGNGVSPSRSGCEQLLLSLFTRH